MIVLFVFQYTPRAIMIYVSPLHNRCDVMRPCRQVGDWLGWGLAAGRREISLFVLEEKDSRNAYKNQVKKAKFKIADLPRMPL
jgi:hypothetical protein